MHHTVMLHDAPQLLAWQHVTSADCSACGFCGSPYNSYKLHHTPAAYYLFERLHIVVWSIGNCLFCRGNRLLFGVRLYVARCTRNNSRYGLCLVRRVEIYVADKADILPFRLSDMSRIWMHGMTVRCFHIHSYLLAGIQTRRKINSIEGLTPKRDKYFKTC